MSNLTTIFNDADRLRAYFMERGWSIHMEDNGRSVIDPFATIIEAVQGAAIADSEGAAPHAEGLPSEALARAIHHAMCEVSHHDSVTVCKNQRKYEMVAESVARHLEVRDAVDA